MRQSFILAQAIFSILILVSSGCSNKHSKDNATFQVKRDSLTVIKTDSVASVKSDSVKIIAPVNALSPQACCLKISSAMMNIVYTGVDNPLTIASPEGAIVSASNGSINFNDITKQYFLRVNSGSETTVRVRMANDSTCSTSQVFKVVRVPDPVAYAGNIKGTGFMSRGEAVILKEIAVKIDNFDFDVKFKIVSFAMTSVVNGVWIEYKSSGPDITPEMRSLLASMKAGNRIVFYDIAVTAPDSTVRTIPGIIIKIK